MEIAILTGGLFVLGKSLLQNKTPRQPLNKRNDIKQTNLGINIYNSNGTKIIRQQEQQILDKRFEASKNPKKTNIINPGTINSECGFDCAYEEPVYAHPSMLPIVSNNGGNDSLFSPLFETPSYLYKDNGNKSLSGEDMVMTHNNMQPHFKGNLKQNMKEDANERRLETFTGVSNSTSIQKSTPTNMFEPVRQQTTPGIFNLDKSRYIPSQYQQHTKPTPEIREKPIPSSVLRPVYKTIDELRVIPKDVYKNITNLGQKAKIFNSNANTEYTVNKDTSYSDERYGNRLSSVSKEQSRENFDICKQEQGELNYTGIPVYNNKINYHNDSIVTKEVDKTKEIGFLRNLNTVTKVNDTFRDSLEPVETQRDSSSTYVSGIAANTNMGVKLYSNIHAPTTLKECNLFDYQGNKRGYLKNKKTDYIHHNNTKRETEYYENLPQGPKINTNYVKTLLKNQDNQQFRMNNGGYNINNRTETKHNLSNKSIEDNRLYPELVAGLKTNEFSIYKR